MRQYRFRVEHDGIRFEILIQAENEELAHNMAGRIGISLGLMLIGPVR